MKIKDWPETERPRERLLAHSAKQLSDAELLAVLLGSGPPGDSAVGFARRLLKHFGNLAALLDAKLSDFAAIKGFGTARFCQLKAVLELGQRYLSQGLMLKQPIQQASDALDYLRARLKSYEHEVFACLLLNSQYQVLHYQELGQGDFSQISVRPRELLKVCFEHPTQAVILAHNHPSGVPEPSQADINTTARLKQALAEINVVLLDHLIIAQQHSCSLAEQGLI